MILSEKIVVNGITRTYQLCIPDKISKEKCFLIFSLHGLGGNSDISIYETSLDARAETDGFIAVFPDALPENINDSADFKSNPRKWIAKPTDGIESHDLIFISALIDELTGKFTIKNVFITGFSNGAIMSSYLALKLPDKITAIAPVCGKLVTPNNADKIIPTLLIIGDSDPIFPIEGGEVKLIWNKSMNVLPFDSMINNWVNLITAPREVSDNYFPDYQLTSYINKDTELSIIKIHNHGHIWPGGKSKLTYRIVGNPNRNISANELIIDFFKKHSK